MDRDADMLDRMGYSRVLTLRRLPTGGGCPNRRVAHYQAANARTDQTLALPAAKPGAVSATTDKANPSADTSTSLKHR